MDNIVNKATEHGPYTYNYDSLYRLSGAASPVLPQETYTYDPVGNRLISATADNWTYNANNELQSYNGVSVQYDANGNTIQKNDNGAVQNFFYNEDDRLTEVQDENGDVIATYNYDPFGRRLWKDVGGARTNFMYADEGLIAEFDGSGTQTKAYGFAPNSTWTTDPLFMKQGGQYFFYHNDHLGTPQKLANASGAISWSAVYDAFGKATVGANSTVTNNLRFPGQYFDQETGLHYNWHRYYEPKSGRYITADPIGILGGINLFVYADLNPIDVFDPGGLICKTESHPGIGEQIGDPWPVIEAVGYWKAVARKILFDTYKISMKALKISTPPITSEAEKKMGITKYKLRYTIFERYLIISHEYSVCYDECTRKLTRDYLGPSDFGKTQDVVVRAYEVDKYLGDPKEYNRNDNVDPLVIRED
jgi:RHS repeat-associated protein